MKRSILFLFVLLQSFATAIGAMAQTSEPEAIYIYRNDGNFNAFFHKDIDSIVCSPIGLDGTVYAYDVVQEFHTPDSVYRIPLAVIDSVAFSAPEPVLQPNVVRMESGLLDYLTAVNGMQLTFTSLPKTLRPSKGEILVCTDFEHPLFEEGFVGKVYNGYAQNNDYIVECDTVSDLSEIFECLISIEEVTGAEEANEVRNTRVTLETEEFTKTITLGELHVEDEDAKFDMSGALNIRYRAILVTNIVNESQHIELTLHHNYNLTAGVEAQAEGGFRKNSKVIASTPAIRFPATFGLLKLQVDFSLFAQGKGSMEFSSQFIGPTLGYVSSIKYKDGQFDPSHDNVTPAGSFTPTVSAEMQMDGSLHCGVLSDVYFGTGKCMGAALGIGLQFYTGPEVTGSFSFKSESLADFDYYNAIKDSKIGFSLLKMTTEGYGRVIWQNEPYEHTFFTFELPPVLHNEWYLFPDFSETTIEKDASQRTVKLNCRPSRNVLLPLTLGYGLYDKEGTLLECQMANDTYKQDDSGYVLEKTFTELKRNKTYEARPMIQFMGNNIPATPAKEFSLECSVTTGGVTDIEETSATCSGMAELPNEYTLCSYGICYSAYNSTPTIDNSTVLEASGGENFSVALSGLKDNTYYYYRAYLVVDENCYYGEVRGFTTKEKEEEKNEPTPGDAIDLGLSVMWASRNVGASSPSDYGDYFAWGETSPKSEYTRDTYKYYSDDYYITKYCTKSGYGTVDNKTVLEPSDDAATANWGSGWRMPTQQEMEELSNKCTWTWTTLNGVNGMLVTGPNGNSIFLPAAGYRSGTSLNYAGSDGDYRSSLLHTGYPNHACSLGFRGGGHYRNYNYRVSGLSVRPVRASAQK